MEVKQVVQWLLDNKYAVIVNGWLVVTKKLNDEILTKDAGAIVKVAADTQKSVEVKKFQISTDDKKKIWNEFIERANIPHRVKDGKGGVYTVRQYNEPAVKKLIEIVRNPDISYDKLVNSTKHYYATVSYKVLLSNYLLKDIWLDEYKNYNPSQITTGDGSSKWED